MTPEQKQIEKQLKETADKIEAGIQDIRDNKASKQEVLDLIDERTKDDKELLTKTSTDIEQLNTGMTEAAESLKTLQKQIRSIGQVNTASLIAPGKYNGHFSSPQEAKTFALLIMAATMSGHAQFKERVDDIHKQLDGMGIEPYWLDASGKKTMTGSSQAGGGALVTVEQIPSVIMLLEQYGKFRANALKMPMGAGSTLMPKIDGLLPVYVPGEGGTITKSDPTIESIALTPKTLCALAAYSMELEDDSLVALGELLAGLFARSFAYAEDRCGFIGDGTGTYFGFKGIVAALRAVHATIANIKSLVVGSGHVYADLALVDFESACGILPEFADDGDAKWYVHRYFFWTVMVKLALAAGSGTAGEILTGQATNKRTYFGYPVEFTQVMPKVEAVNQICALLANLRQGAYLGTRGGIEFAQSDQRYFDQGLIAVRGRDRVAINVHGVGNTTDAGPICGLITAAS